METIWERLSGEDVAYFLLPKGERADFLNEAVNGVSLAAYSPALASWRGFLNTNYGALGVGVLIAIGACFFTLIMSLSLLSVLSGSSALMAGEDALRKSLGESMARPYLRGFFESSFITILGGIPALIVAAIVFWAMNEVARSTFFAALPYYSLNALAIIGAFLLFLLLGALLAPLLLPSGEKGRKAALRNRFR